MKLPPRLTILLLLTALLHGHAPAQRYYSPPKEARIFTSLEDALKSPGEVEYLRLRYKSLGNLPEEIMDLPRLKYLDLHGNRIRNLPEWIGQLKHLEYLDLSRNKLQLLSPEISKLTSLRYLILRHNDIGYLPDVLCDMTSLKALDISSTYIYEVPECISALSVTLEVLNIRYLQMTRDEMERVLDLLPATRVYHGAGCRCNS